MYRYSVSRRRVVRDVENVVLAVEEGLRASGVRGERLLFFLGVGDEVKIASRDLAAEIIAVDSFGDAEVHADTGFAARIGPARAVDVLLGEEAGAPGPGLDLPAFLAEEFRHLIHAQALVDRLLN